MTTIAVCGFVWGDDDHYWRHLDGWFDAVAALNRKPDELVFSTRPQDAHRLEGRPCRIVTCEDARLDPMINAAMMSCESEWLSQCSVDDRYLPEAFDDLDGLPDTVEVVSVGVVTTNRVQIAARPVHNLWSGDPNMILGTSFIKRSVFREIGGYDSRFAISDWALWIKAARAGAEFWCTPRFTHVIDIDSPGRYSSQGFPAEEHDKIRRLLKDGTLPGE